jgi:hypothetical protein
MLRAAQIALTAPRGPVYLNLEVAMQEARIAELPPLPDAARYTAPPPVRPAPDLVTEAARLLSEAKQPVIFAGRCTRSVEAWNARVQLAEKLNAPVVTNIKLGASFPTDHRLHAATPGAYLAPEAYPLVAGADVVLSLDYLDLASALREACGGKPFPGKVIHVSCDAHSHRGWSMDHQGLPRNGGRSRHPGDRHGHLTPRYARFGALASPEQEGPAFGGAFLVCGVRSQGLAVASPSSSARNRSGRLLKRPDGLRGLVLRGTPPIDVVPLAPQHQVNQFKQ